MKQLLIKVKEVPIKAYNNISKVKRYYNPLYYIYKIIYIELKNKGINNKACL